MGALCSKSTPSEVSISEQLPAKEQNIKAIITNPDEMPGVISKSRKNSMKQQHSRPPSRKSRPQSRQNAITEAIDAARSTFHTENDLPTQQNLMTESACYADDVGDFESPIVQICPDRKMQTLVEELGDLALGSLISQTEDAVKEVAVEEQKENLPEPSVAVVALPRLVTITENLIEETYESEMVQEAYKGALNQQEIEVNGQISIEEISLDQFYRNQDLIDAEYAQNEREFNLLLAEVLCKAELDRLWKAQEDAETVLMSQEEELSSVYNLQLIREKEELRRQQEEEERRVQEEIQLQERLRKQKLCYERTMMTVEDVDGKRLREMEQIAMMIQEQLEKERIEQEVLEALNLKNQEEELLAMSEEDHMAEVQNAGYVLMQEEEQTTNTVMSQEEPVGIVNEEEPSNILKELERQGAIDDEKLVQVTEQQITMSQESPNKKLEMEVEKATSMKFSDMLSKWNVRTISVNLEGSIDDGTSSTFDDSESGDDPSLSSRVGRVLAQQTGAVIMRRKSSNKRFPLKKKKRVVLKQDSELSTLAQQDL